MQIVVPDLSAGRGAALAERQEVAATRREALRRGHQARSSSASEGDFAWNGGLFVPMVDPDSVDVFSCLGVHITGADISVDYPELPVPSDCGSSVPSSVKSPGKILGLVPVTGGTLSLDVPMGAEVTVQLFGLVSSDGTCTSVSRTVSDISLVHEILSGAASGVDLSGLQALRVYDLPLELASSSVTMTSDSQLRLTPRLEAGNLRPVFCDGAAALQPRLSLLDVTQNGISVTANPSSARSALSSSGASGSYEVSVLLEFDQHVQDFSLPQSLQIAGGSLLGDGFELAPGGYWLDIEVSDLDRFEVVLPAGKVRDLYGRVSLLAQGDIGTQVRARVASADSGGGGSSAVGGGSTPLATTVSIVGSTRTIQISSNDADPEFEIRDDTSGPIQFQVDFNKVTTWSGTGINCTRCSVVSTAVDPLSGGSRYLVTVEPSAGLQSGRVELSLASGTAITADGIESYAAIAGDYFYVKSSVSPVPSVNFASGVPSNITSGTGVGSSGTCSTVGMPIQVDLVIPGTPEVLIDSDTVECTGGLTGTWSATLSFGSYPIPAWGTNFQIKAYPVTDIDLAETSTYGSASASSIATIDLTVPSAPGVSPASGGILSASNANITVTCNETTTLHWRVLGGGPSGSLGCNSGVGTFELQSMVSTGLVKLEVFLRDTAGNQSGTVTNYLYKGDLTVLSPYSANAGVQNWNHYVRTTDTTALCDGTETGANACIHAGERRKVVTGFTSCSGLSMADQLSLFDWSCAVDSGAATFSGSLKSGKSLSDLIDSANYVWKSNRVSLTYITGGSPANVAFEGSSAAWWSNTVAPLNSRVLLSNEGEVVVVASNESTAGVNLANNRISLLVMPGAVLSWTSGSPTNCDTTGGSTATLRCLVQSNSKHFLWIEGSFSGSSTAQGSGAERLLSVFGSADSRVHASTFLKTAVPASGGSLTLEGHCIAIDSSIRSVLGHISVSNCSGAGVDISNTDAVLMERLESTRNGTHGLQVRNGSASNHFYEVTLAGNILHGVNINIGGVGNVFDQISSYANRVTGLFSMGTQKISISSPDFSPPGMTW